jgi:hypothetical protein
MSMKVVCNGDTTTSSTPQAFSDMTGAITNAQFPSGLTNFNTTIQSMGQLSAATPIYITNSNINLPATLVNGIKSGTVLQWHFNVGKNANGTGATSILLYYGTHGSVSDTAYVTQALPASTAALDTMTVDIYVTFTSTTACSYVIGVSHTAASAAGFGVTSGTPAYAGTVTGMTTTTGSLIFGVGIECAAGGTLPSYTVGVVEAQAFNLD